MPTDNPDNANVIAIPPVIVLATLVLGWVLNFFWPAPFLARPYALWLGVLFIVVAFPIVLGAVVRMLKAKTTIDVRKPTTDIVTDGVFGISRNPMYLSLMLVYLGIASLVDSLWMLLLVLPLVVIFQKGVIEREELYLERKFGEKYLTYKSRVRRWI
jgi:protein-S-isoprenylcysteine O-methyltransferase Ste14